MSKPNRFFFTPAEIELLRHRLEVYDCICEVLADAESDEIADIAINDPSAVHFVTLQLMGEMQMGKSIEYIVALAQREPLWGAVLRDAIEGSTYVCSIPTNDPDAAPRRRAHVRTGRSVVTKLRAAGFSVGDVPEL